MGKGELERVNWSEACHSLAAVKGMRSSHSIRVGCRRQEVWQWCVTVIIFCEFVVIVEKEK